MTPPLIYLIGYRLFGIRLPEQYRPWVAEDVKTSSFLWLRSARTFLWGMVLYGLYAVGQRIGLHDWPSKRTLLRAVFLLVAVTLLSSRDVLARRMLRWQCIDADGEPVEPRRFARLSGIEALLLALMFLVAWTAGATAFGYGLRPTGVAAAKCREPDADIAARIAAGARSKSVKFVTERAVSYDNGTVVVGFLENPSDTKHPKVIEAWVVQGDNVYKLASKENEGSTNFPVAPQSSIDRVTGQALERAFKCITPALPR